jgi:ribosomal protein S18 acetylase RimI-like enzyme
MRFFVDILENRVYLHSSIKKLLNKFQFYEFMDRDLRVQEMKEGLLNKYLSEGFNVYSLNYFPIGKRSSRYPGVIRRGHAFSLDIYKNLDDLADLSFYTLGNEAEIENICVNSLARGKGYGKKIIGTLEGVLKEFDFSEVFVTPKDDEGALRFFESMGYAKRDRHSREMVKYLSPVFDRYSIK